MEQILPVFSSNIVTCIIEKNTDVLKKETKFANNDYQKDTGRDNYRVLEKYPKVKKTLLEKYKKFAREQLNYTENFEISTSWVTQIETGGQCQKHCHKNSFYSGVYYFDEYEEDEGGVLEIMTPLSNHFDFNVMPEDWNVYTGRVLKFSPKKNLLILFPSYLFHQVLSYEGTSIRKSLAFNIVPIGFYGDGDSSYNTRWT